MSTKINDGGPAFPSPHYHGYGMTLRDYFAAKAIEGLIAYKSEDAPLKKMANTAYKIADAMLKAREGE